MRWEHLDGNAAAQPRIARAVDLAHTARAERRDDLVRAEASAWGQGHERACYCIRMTLKTRKGLGVPPAQIATSSCRAGPGERIMRLIAALADATEASAQSLTHGGEAP